MWCATAPDVSCAHPGDHAAMSLRNLTHFIEYGAVRAAMAAAGALPVPVLQRIGAGAGALAFDVFRVRRGVSVENIQRALGVSRGEAVRIARRAYRNLGRYMLEFSAFAHLRPEQVLELVTFDGFENLTEALSRGRGIVFVTGHFGDWELLGAAMAARGIPMDALVGEQANGRVDDVMNDLRRRQGLGIITRSVALRKVLQALGGNRMVAMLADQDARSQGIMVDFLGRPASTVRGPAVFAVKRGSPIVTGFIHREGNRHRAVINPPLDPPDLPEDEAVRWLTQAHADALAAAIREHPDEYFWPHRRWKTKPPTTAVVTTG